MTWLARHAIAVAVVASALMATGIAFAFARPSQYPFVILAPPHDLPYGAVTYTAADAKRAFATVGVKLEHAHGPNAANGPVTIVGSLGPIVEVDAFGDPEAMTASGFSNYVYVHGHWVQAPASCAPGVSSASLWRANIRAVVTCKQSVDASTRWLRRARRALASL